MTKNDGNFAVWVFIFCENISLSPHLNFSDFYVQFFGWPFKPKHLCTILSCFSCIDIHDKLKKKEFKNSLDPHWTPFSRFFFSFASQIRVVNHSITISSIILQALRAMNREGKKSIIYLYLLTNQMQQETRVITWSLMCKIVNFYFFEIAISIKQGSLLTL